MTVGADAAKTPPAFFDANPDLAAPGRSLDVSPEREVELLKGAGFASPELSSRPS